MGKIKAFKKLIIYDSLERFSVKILDKFLVIILDLGQILWVIYFIMKWKWKNGLLRFIRLLNENWILCDIDFCFFNHFQCQVNEI